MPKFGMFLRALCEHLYIQIYSNNCSSCFSETLEAGLVELGGNNVLIDKMERKFLVS